MFDTVKNDSLSEQVYAQLRGRIVRGELQPGQELPSERQLSELLGVNRGAVREAIKRLQQACLVKVRHGGATRVEDYRDTAGLELLSEVVVSAAGDISMEVARGILAMRQALAPVVAASAAAQTDRRFAASLIDIAHRMQSCSDIAALQHAAFEYWSLVVKHSANVVFRLAFNSMNTTYRAVWSLMTHIMQDEFKDSDTLLQLAYAIERADATQAHTLAAQHVALGGAALSALLSQLHPTTTTNP